MTSLLINLKLALRNKRFLIFTIVVPSIWFLFFVYVFKNVSTLSGNSLALFTALFGIMGNGINTFSTHVSTTKNFYDIENKISPYSNSKQLFVSLITETILNFFIIIMVTVVGLLVHQITFTSEYFVSITLLLFTGLYFLIFGFLLGNLFDVDALASLSFPIFIAFSLTILTPNAIHIKGLEFISFLQKIFPGYYLNSYFASNHSTDSLINNLIPITICICLAFLLTVFILSQKKHFKRL